MAVFHPLNWQNIELSTIEDLNKALGDMYATWICQEQWEVHFTWTAWAGHPWSRNGCSQPLTVNSSQWLINSKRTNQRVTALCTSRVKHKVPDKRRQIAARIFNAKFSESEPKQWETFLYEVFDAGNQNSTVRNKSQYSSRATPQWPKNQACDADI